MRVVSWSCLRRRRTIWQGIAFGLVLAVGLGSIPRGATSVTPSKEIAAPKKVLTVDRIFSDPPLVPPAPSEIQWLPDSRGVTYLKKTAGGDNKATRLVMREVPSGKERTLCVVDTITVPADLKKGESDTLEISAYQWAKTGSLMMFEFRDEIFTFSRRDGEVLRRTQNDTPEDNPTFSPDGKKIAFTRKKDLWVLDLDSKTETRLTTTGSDSLFNGVLDWVYEEELFSRGNDRAFEWSPDSKRIAFLEFDESPVPRFPIVDFIPVHNTTETQFYPVPGDSNPIVRVGVVDLSTGGATWMSVDTRDDSYVARIHWLRDSAHLAIEKLNRNQDRLTLFLADARSGEAREILTETSDAWVDVTDSQHYYDTKDRFVWGSDRDGFLHLYLYGNDGTLTRQLTQGRWTVSELNAVDEKRGVVYFTGLEKSILERHLYRTSEEVGEIERITEREGTHAVTFSPDCKYYFDRFSSVTTPRVITLHAASGKELFTIDKPETSELETYALPAPEFFTVTSENGLTFHCSTIKPRDFDPSRKYPVLVYTYGYPNAQVVQNQWGRSTYLWHAAMAQGGFIVFSLDNRGSYGRGKEWASTDLKTIGLKGLEDQVAGVAYLKSLPYVDASRIGIWGWSGGGTMTALAMLKAPGVFTAGAAVAPVTDWRFYDSIFTERYMKGPKDNEAGYRDASPVNFADSLEGAFLLVHGTADDNVHMQNSLYLARELIKAGKDFDLMIYPGGAHGIGGNKERAHLFNKLTRFFEEHLKPQN
jgi:dipeptidyl-peptidase-4